MKAVLLLAYGGPDQLDYRTNVPRPEPQHGEVLVRVHATSLNPVDWKIRSGELKGRFPQDLPAILGRDLAGEIAAVGPGIDAFTQGQRVMALGNNTYAEYTIAKADTLAPIPGAMDYKQAAALPLVITTGAQLIERAAKVQRGQAILITGALGSVGRTAIFVAKQHGAHVKAGVRKAQTEEAKALGADQVIALDDSDQISGLKNLDVVADTVGGKVGESLLPAIKPGGCYASVVGAPAGADKLDLRIALMMAQPDASRLAELAEDVANGKLSIPVSKVLALKEIRQAHELGEEGGSNGKIVLIP